MTVYLRILYCLCIVCALSCQNEGEDCIYIIPQGFEGNVLIILDHGNGVEKMYDSGRRVYQIDTSGVLRSQFGINKGVHQKRFFWAESRSELRLLHPSQINDTLENSVEVFVYNMETVTDYDTKNLKERYSELFTVSSIAKFDSIGNAKSNFTWRHLK